MDIDVLTPNRCSNTIIYKEEQTHKKTNKNKDNFFYHSGGLILSFSLAHPTNAKTGMTLDKNMTSSTVVVI